MGKPFTFQKFLVLIILCVVSANCLVAQQADTYYIGNKSYNTHHYSYKVFSAANNSFGYNIYDSEVLIIHQPTVPGKQGWNGFSNKEEAVSAALRIIEEKVNPKTLLQSTAADSPNSK